LCPDHATFVTDAGSTAQRNATQRTATQRNTTTQSTTQAQKTRMSWGNGTPSWNACAWATHTNTVSSAHTHPQHRITTNHSESNPHPTRKQIPRLIKHHPTPPPLHHTPLHSTITARTHFMFSTPVVATSSRRRVMAIGSGTRLCFRLSEMTCHAAECGASLRPPCLPMVAMAPRNSCRGVMKPLSRRPEPKWTARGSNPHGMGRRVVCNREPANTYQ